MSLAGRSGWCLRRKGGLGFPLVDRTSDRMLTPASNADMPRQHSATINPLWHSDSFCMFECTRQPASATQVSDQPLNFATTQSAVSPIACFVHIHMLRRIRNADPIDSNRRCCNGREAGSWSHPARTEFHRPLSGCEDAYDWCTACISLSSKDQKIPQDSNVLTGLYMASQKQAAR